MKLKDNQKKNLQALLSVALKTHYKNIIIADNVIENENNIVIKFIRKMSVSELKLLNAYFISDVRNKKISYNLTIYNSQPKDCIITIENINSQVTLFTDKELLISQRINNYNNNITNRLRKFVNLLIDTFNDNSEHNEWTFYYIARDNSHIGFANNDKTIDKSYKIFKNHYGFLKNKENAPFYDNVEKFIGTENDAKCMCLRRNYNSKHNGSWKVCKFGTSINHLWNI